MANNMHAGGFPQGVRLKGGAPGMPAGLVNPQANQPFAPIRNHLLQQ